MLPEIPLINDTMSCPESNHSSIVNESTCYDPFLVTESERLLDAYGFLAGAIITAEDDGTGGKNLTVATQDEWSTKVDMGITYDDAALNIENFEVTEGGFAYASELVDFIRQRGDFCIGAACYPEVHPEAADAAAGA